MPALLVAVALTALGAGPPPDTLQLARAGAPWPMPLVARDTAVALPPAPAAQADTTRRPRRAVSVSDGYALRLRIHRYGSYTMLPLFAAQSIAGNQMYQSGGASPQWAKTMHGVGAGGLAALFGVNTITGAWNMWESREVREGRTRRLVHGGLMLAADAGFAYAGARLGPEATRSGDARRRHRTVAMISMSGALLGYATMLVGDR